MLSPRIIADLRAGEEGATRIFPGGDDDTRTSILPLLMRIAALLLLACVVPAAAQPRLPGQCPVTDDACKGSQCQVDIRTSDPSERQRLKEGLARNNTTVRLGPDVTLDFTGLPPEFFPMTFGRCVTLTSVARFDDAVIGYDTAAFPGSLPVPEARTPSTPGPLLKFGPHREGVKTFLEIRSFPGNLAADHVRISGFRIYGPSFGQQETSEVAIRIIRSVGITIANMEIAGWPEQGVRVEDDPGEDQDPSTNNEGPRISDPSQILVTGSWIHHNQNPVGAFGGHAGGYGVDASTGGWATITRTVFDFNRHALAAHGNSGGYTARRNLVLKGGGYHGNLFNTYTHQFDVHGTGSNGLGGLAGGTFVYDANAFQYRKDNAIKIRGKPRNSVTFTNNIFPHPGLENDWGDDAINLDTTTNVHIGTGNRIEIDTFGQYGVCDFDGDGIDDLFLATGASWWFSSFGEFYWWHLSDNNERLKDVRLGYFDHDAKCDVLTRDASGRWVVSSGGTGAWLPLGSFNLPLENVVFGRFDPNVRDHRPGRTRQTTHAFRRERTGQWSVTPLVVQNWQPVQSSSFPLANLRFGDFNGDGVTDVLAVNGGRWSISDAARSPWRRINANLGEAVAGLYIANLDADDNIDDLLKLDRKFVQLSSGPPQPVRMRAELTWWRSKNGTGPWVKLKSYTFNYTVGPEAVTPGTGFAGRFGVAPGGGTMLIDPNRIGRFFSPAETARGASPDWTSTVAY